MEIILYSRPKCPLCVEAREKLDIICDILGLTYEEVDIYSDDRLLEKYQLMIPVVEAAGDIILFGNITYSALKAAIDAKLDSI